VVLAIIIFILVLGVVLWISAMMAATDSQRSKHRRICPGEDCGHVNPKRARYCARCGRKLTGPEEGNRSSA
jgi:hypothetical protein